MFERQRRVKHTEDIKLVIGKHRKDEKRKMKETTRFVLKEYVMRRKTEKGYFFHGFVK